MNSTLYILAKINNIAGSEVPRVSADNVWSGVMTSVYWVAGVAAVIALIIAGFLFVTANGDPGKVKTAKNAVLFAVIGLIVVSMAYVLTQFIMNNVA